VTERSWASPSNFASIITNASQPPQKPHQLANKGIINTKPAPRQSTVNRVPGAFSEYSRKLAEKRRLKNKDTNNK
jgi:hypothetical protein